MRSGAWSVSTQLGPLRAQVSPQAADTWLVREAHRQVVNRQAPGGSGQCALPHSRMDTTH